MASDPAATPTHRRASRALAWSMSGNLLLRVGNLCVTLVVARIIAPDAYGIFGIGLTIWALLGTLAEGGFGTDLIRSREPERILPTVTTLGLVTGGVLAGAVVLSAPLLAMAFDAPGSESVIRVMGLGLATVGLSLVPAALLAREYRQREILFINLAGLVTLAVVTLGLALADLGAMALAIGQVSSQLAILVGQYIAVRRLPRFGWDGGIAVESIRFCLPLALANLVSWLLLSVDNLIVSRLLGEHALGLYIMAFNVSSWPMSAVGQAIRVVALPAFSHVGQAEKRVRGLLVAVGPVTLLATLMGLGLGWLARPLFATLFSAQWAPAADVLVGLAVFGAMRVLFDMLATYLIAAGASRLVMVVQVVWMGAMIPCMIAAVHWFGLVGAGWAHVLVAAVVVLPAYLWALRRVGVGVAPMVRAVGRPLLFAPVASLAVIGVLLVIAQPFLQLIVGGLICTAFYVLPQWRWLLQRIRELRSPLDDVANDDSTRRMEEETR